VGVTGERRRDGARGRGEDRERSEARLRERANEGVSSGLETETNRSHNLLR
jgi:hypothetical protein